jgi:LPS-assembly protein
MTLLHALPRALRGLLFGALAAAPGAGWAQDSNAAACQASEGGDCGSPAELREEVLESGYPLDWVPYEELPEALRDRHCRLCGGAYVDPKANADGNPDTADIEATAERSELEGDTVRLEGGVEVRQGYRDLRGDSANYDRGTARGTLEGNITVREPGLLLRGTRGEFYSRNGEAQLEDSQFVLHRQHMRGTADLLSRDAENLIRVEDGTLTYCPPGSHDWLLETRQMTLDPESGRGVARGAMLSAGGVPFFYAPWISFPIDDRRRTGFLFPTAGNDSRGGLDVTVPFYMNLAPNYDLLYTPRYIQERGFNHELQARYLDPWRGNWLVGGSYLADDEQFQADFPGAENSDRWLARVEHNGLYQQRWRSRIDFTEVSDVNFIRDLETSNLETRREVNLLQLATLDYLGDDWLVNIEAQQFQSLADDIRNDYKKLPQITLQRRGAREPFSVDPIFLAQYSNFDSSEDLVTGQRLYAEAGAAYPMLWESGFLNTTAKYRLLQYSLENNTLSDDDTPSAASGLLSVDGGLYFERDFRIANRGLIQTLEPRLYYLYSSFEDQRDQPDFDSAELTFTYNQLFRDTRFSGNDRLDDANRLSVGLTTRFLDATDGRELFNASLGQILYFENRRVRVTPGAPELQRSNSEMAGELNFYPNERLSLRASAQYDASTNKMNAGNAQASYEREDGQLINVGYTYRRPIALIGEQPVTAQAHLSTYYPLNDEWRAFAAWNYSTEANSSVEDMFGIEYDSCCFKVRFLHLRYFDTARGAFPDFNAPNLDRERAFQVQFVLKGLGGVGEQVEQLMTDMIRGFYPRET